MVFEGFVILIGIGSMSFKVSVYLMDSLCIVMDRTANGGRWSNWGDAQIQDNSYVGTHYQNALNTCGNGCLNGNSKAIILKRLGLN